MKNAKVIALVVAFVLLLILILMNLAQTTVTIFFMKIEMPLALLLAVVALIAYAAGVITDGRLLRKPKEKK